MRDESVAVVGMTQRKSTQFIMRMDPELKADAGADARKLCIETDRPFRGATYGVAQGTQSAKT